MHPRTYTRCPYTTLFRSFRKRGAMRRETTNAIRTVLEEVLPPFVRDSAAMRWLFRRHWGRLVDDLEDFRARIPFVTPEEYRDVYARLPRVQSETDNSRACIDLIRSEEHTSELQSLMR